MHFLFGFSHRGVYVSSPKQRVTSFLHLGHTWRVKSMFQEATRVRAGSLPQLLGLLIFPLMPRHNSYTPLLVLSSTRSLASPKESSCSLTSHFPRHYKCLHFYYYCMFLQTECLKIDCIIAIVCLSLFPTPTFFLRKWAW